MKYKWLFPGSFLRWFYKMDCGGNVDDRKEIEKEIL
jgi:hypothetical protein